MRPSSCGRSAGRDAGKPLLSPRTGHRVAAAGPEAHASSSSTSSTPSAARVAPAPNSGGHAEREQTLNQILTEMDGFDSREGVIVLAATNRADVLDQALLRPGRFDRRVVVQRPDRAGRAAILKVHTKSAGASAKHSSESDGPGAYRLPRGGTRAARAVGASLRPGASGFDRATRHSAQRDISTPRRRSDESAGAHHRRSGWPRGRAALPHRKTTACRRRSSTSRTARPPLS